MNRFFLFLLFIVESIYGEGEQSEWSLERMCRFYGGTFRRRSGIHDIYGDHCQFEFNIADPLFCEKHIPYTIRWQDTSTFGTKCLAEATLICDSESVQLFGRCYKVKRKIMHLQEAIDSCQIEGRSVAFVYREDLIKLWNDYFPSVDRIWALSSACHTTDLIHDTGDDLLIAFDGYPFNLPPRSLVKVDGTEEKAFAMCEYTPRMTSAHLRHLGQQYSKIYYPSISVEGEGLFVRTFSSRQWSGDKKNDDAYCKRVLQAFLLLEGVTVTSATLSMNFLRGLPEDYWNTFYRTSIHYENPKMEVWKRSEKCQVDRTPIEKFGLVDPEIWADDQPRVSCDAASASTVIRNAHLETFSDARWAPMFCQVSVNH